MLSLIQETWPLKLNFQLCNINLKYWWTVWKHGIFQPRTLCFLNHKNVIRILHSWKPSNRKWLIRMSMANLKQTKRNISEKVVWVLQAFFNKYFSLNMLVCKIKPVLIYSHKNQKILFKISGKEKKNSKWKSWHPENVNRKPVLTLKGKNA